MRKRKLGVSAQIATKLNTSKDRVLETLRAKGYWCRALLLNTRDFRWVQNRKRYYFLAIKMKFLTRAGVSCSELDGFCDEVFSISKRGHPQQTLADILLPECHECIQGHLTKLLQQAAANQVIAFDANSPPPSPTTDAGDVAADEPDQV